MTAEANHFADKISIITDASNGAVFKDDDAARAIQEVQDELNRLAAIERNLKEREEALKKREAGIIADLQTRVESMSNTAKADALSFVIQCIKFRIAQIEVNARKLSGVNYNVSLDRKAELEDLVEVLMSLYSKRRVPGGPVSF